MLRRMPADTAPPCRRCERVVNCPPRNAPWLAAPDHASRVLPISRSNLAKADTSPDCPASDPRLAHRLVTPYVHAPMSASHLFPNSQTCFEALPCERPSDAVTYAAPELLKHREWNIGRNHELRSSFAQAHDFPLVGAKDESTDFHLHPLVSKYWEPPYTASQGNTA
ncbi:hypothetical protein LMG24235_03777 [Paraburkholderia sabiae]|nr:hypothetical protein LMG24235_03777 [Paraburkholderia sabiae]